MINVLGGLLPALIQSSIIFPPLGTERSVRAIFASNSSIPLEVHKGDFETREEFDTEMVKVLSAYKPDLIVLAGFMRILSPKFINAFTGKILNIHPSLLPKYPGLNTHERVLESSDKIHGITVHFVDESLDGGPICAQSSIQINTSSVKELEEEIHKLEHELYPKVVSWFGEGLLRLTEGKVYFENRELKIGEINEK